MKQRSKEMRKLLWPFLTIIFISALSSKSDLHSQTETWLTFSLLWVYKPEEEVCLMQMWSLPDALAKVSSLSSLHNCCPEVQCCWVEDAVLKPWQLETQLSLGSLSPSVAPLFERASFWSSLVLLLFFSALAQNQGSQKVKDCPEKQVRIYYMN